MKQTYKLFLLLAFVLVASRESINVYIYIEILS